MAKVLVTRKVAEAIDKMRKAGMTDFNILRQSEGAMVTPEYLTLQRWAFSGNGAGSPDLLMQALVSGYEIEKTPEELQAIAYGKVRAFYAELERKESKARIWDDYDEVFRNMNKRHATTDVLRMLDIKIEGVNA